MNNNGYELKENMKIDREFVEELIYENIRLTDINYELGFDNQCLRKKVEQLEKTNKRLTQAALTGVNEEQIIIIMKKNALKTDNFIL